MRPFRTTYLSHSHEQVKRTETEQKKEIWMNEWMNWKQ